MKELLRRFKLWPILSFELALASLFIGILGLSAPIFVIQVLRRYVSNGIDGTLVTLVSGVDYVDSTKFLQLDNWNVEDSENSGKDSLAPIYVRPAAIVSAT